MVDYRRGAHTVFEIHLHLVWITKYRRPALNGEVAVRVNREIPLLAISGREIVRTAVDIQKEIVEVAAWESDRGKTIGRTEGRGRIELVARISKARRKRWIESRIVMAGILESIEDAVTGP